MPVGEFAREFAAQLASEGICLTADVTVSWLSGKGHHHPGAVSIGEDVRERLSDIYRAVNGLEALLISKRHSRCGVDFQLDERTFIELDEVQHFSSQRLTTLHYYNGLPHFVDVPLYQQLCRRFRATADRAWAKPVRNEFAFVGGRTSQRAYLDSVRDLIAPTQGVTLLRIPAPEGSLRLATDRLKKALEAANPY